MISTNKKQLAGNYYSVLLKRLLVAFVFMLASRLLFFAFNFSNFSGASLWDWLWFVIAGIRFDISALFALNGIFILLMVLPIPWRKNRFYLGFANLFYYMANTVGFLVNFIDIIYARFTQKRMTGDIFDYVANDESTMSLLPQFVVDFWYLFLLFLFFEGLFIYFSRKIVLRKKPLHLPLFSYYAFQLAGFLIAIFITVIAVRGGFQLKPINIITAGQYVEARYVPLVLNTPFTIMKTIGQYGLKQVRYYDDDTLNRIYTPVLKKQDIQVLYGDTAFRPNNVVLIIMESLSREHIGALNKQIGNYPGFTPFLDSLIGHSVVFNGFANGKQSIEGIPAVISSLPSLMNRPYIISPYAGNKTYSLAGVLKEKGYHTAFYHGGTNGTMDFDGFAKMAGFDSYIGRTEYNNEADWDGNWGIFDEPFFRFFATEVDNTRQPFFATLFSLSAHHPYTIPTKHKNKFRKGELEIQEAVMYADFSLRELFQTISKMEWYSNTIFIITADHTSEAYLPEYRTRLGMYRIPIIFFDPGEGNPVISPVTASQVDIMPSVLSLLNYDHSILSFGNNLFNREQDHFAVNHLNGIYQLISDQYILEFDGAKSIGLYNFDTDILLEYNLIDADRELAVELEKLIKAYIQQYNNRMVENKLTLVE
nr:LTA synthase family protein [Bacteroidota bacterium]